MTAPMAATTKDAPEAVQLVAGLEHAAVRAHETLNDDAGREGSETAVAVVQGVSDELLRVVTQLDFDTPLAWRLLRAREALDSHMIAATALANTESDSAGLVAMLRRGLDTLVTELGAIPAEP